MPGTSVRWVSACRSSHRAPGIPADAGTAGQSCGETLEAGGGAYARSRAIAGRPPGLPITPGLPGARSVGYLATTGTQASFPPGKAGAGLRRRVPLRRRRAACTWPISAGALPPGLKINASASEVTGTPATAGSLSFTAWATGSTGTFLDTPETIRISS